ncbi:hypothetical protein HYPSUDRAFT_893481 [Hypholoma sublateritium FD-334 SS-4]|uniref:Uncharacterized protein n=1 Tax=Hypholoma sublateritium (strain FD-334 SS-4) TaxID=945553 RepID=A0A0D2PGY2_HYPSF|nr:hypothetical protein HYPSUDRAFT_893481 [Hypholoma sublateritium FD-334 SS-4]
MHLHLHDAPPADRNTLSRQAPLIEHPPPAATLRPILAPNRCSAPNQVYCPPARPPCAPRRVVNNTQIRTFPDRGRVVHCAHTPHIPYPVNKRCVPAPRGLHSATLHSTRKPSSCPPCSLPPPAACPIRAARCSRTRAPRTLRAEWRDVDVRRA